MTYRGRVKNGVVVLDPPAALAEGAEVEVHLLEQPGSTDAGDAQTLYEQLEPLIGKLNGLPADFAENHDHYLYGVPKRK